MLKFDFLFFLGFTIQFLVVVRGSNDVEYGITVLMIPITIAVLVTAGWSVRRECRAGMFLVIVLYTSCLGYLIFKMQRIYDPLHSTLFMPMRTSLTVFAALPIVLLDPTAPHLIRPRPQLRRRPQAAPCIHPAGF